VKNLAKPLLVSILTLPLMLAISSNIFGKKPPQYYVDEAKLPFVSLPGTVTECLWGIHKGAGYRIEVPENWNGDLVMYAHGYAGTGLELIVEEPLFMRQWLIDNGFAWAASSYSRNDYDVSTGAIDMHALTARFNGIVGRPNYTYIVSHSMGSQVAAVMIEQWPNTYDGAMPCCGVMGDYEIWDFRLDFNAVAQALAGVYAGIPVPEDYLTTYVPDIKQNLEPDPGLFPFSLNENGEHLKEVTKILSGGERPVFDSAWISYNIGFPPYITPDSLFSQIQMLGNGTAPRSPGIVFDNMDTIYQFDTDPALTPAEQALNESVLRVARDPQSADPNGLSNIPVVNGNITVPVLTLHTLGDLQVPFSMQQIYAKRVAANGASDLLVQRAIRDFGHCFIFEPELIAGFMDLVNWVENGVKPAGDDVLDPAVVADPDYGCTFTNPERAWITPCSTP
jgi:pimeloyl-ACP methyl ester carboxylesterase